MVRSVITLVEPNHAFTAAAPDAIDKAADHEIAAGEKGGKMLLIARLSAATAADTITVVAGANPPAWRAGIGDLVFEATGGAEDVVLGPIETARYLQVDGKIYIDVAGATIAGTLEAYALP
jgi:hypothetical protein